MHHYLTSSGRVAVSCDALLAGVLAENNRLSEFAKISNTFDELVAAARGEVMATITTASVRPFDCWKMQSKRCYAAQLVCDVCSWCAGAESAGHR